MKVSCNFLFSFNIFLMLLGVMTANRQSQKYFKKVEKVPALSWKNIISNHSARSEIDCAFNCGNEQTCAGFKYKFGANSPSINCQLSDTTAGKHDMAICDDQGWVFFIDITKKLSLSNRATEKLMNTTPGILTTEKKMTTTPGIRTTEKLMNTTPGIPATEKKITTTPGILTTVLPHECFGYTWLNENSRNKKYSVQEINCDDGLSGWYRFGGGAGIKIATSCVPLYRCGTYATGWMNGAHPTVDEGKVTRKVCYHWNSNCCFASNNIEVVNCGQYYVYKLSPSPCYDRYCGSDN